MADETKEARELRELLAELRYSYGDASQDEQNTAADLIESQAQRIEEFESYLAWDGCNTGDCPHDTVQECADALGIRLAGEIAIAEKLQAENATLRATAELVEELQETQEHHLKMLDGAVEELKRLGIHADEYGSEETLVTATRKVVDEMERLRATAELIERALRDYVLAQSRMADRWAEADEAVKRQLWKDLHFCEACGREALEALQAITTQPTTSPVSSDNSGT